MFCWIEFGTVGWLRDQADVLGHLEVFGLVPSRLIHLHHEKVLGEGGGYMLQEQIHHRGICPGQDQRGHFPLCWGHSSVHVGIFAHHLSRGSWSDAWGSPSPSRLTDAAKAAFIFGHLQHWSLIAGITRGYRRLDSGLEVFLKVACSSALASYNKLSIASSGKFPLSEGILV